MSTLKVDGRFARHRLIDGFSQELVSSLKLAVVGAGAIGNELIKNLMLIGVGSIDVYDFDTVELSNLTRSVFLRESDLGLNKADALVRRAQDLHPGTLLRAVPGDIRRTLSLSQFASFDMVIAAVDNLEARLRLNDMALLTNSDWMNLAIDARHAVVELFPSQEAERACYACSLPNSAFERMAARYSCAGLQRAAWIERKIPTTAITASAVSALACSELLRFLHQKRVTTGVSGTGLFGAYRTDAAQRIYLDTVAPTVSRSLIRKAGAARGCPGCALIQTAKSLVTIDTQVDPTQGIERLNLTHSAALLTSVALDQIEHEMHRIAQFENSTTDSLQITLSDRLILSCTCAQCGANSDTSTVLDSFKGRRAHEQTDNITNCPNCLTPSLVFEISESLSGAEFQGHFAFAIPDCSWLNINDHALDLMGEPTKMSSPK